MSRTTDLADRWLTPQRLATLVLVVLGAYAAINMIRALRTILLLVLVSLFLSFAMEPAVQWLSQRGMRRGAGTALVFFGAFVLSVGVIASMVPMMINQLSDLARNVPFILDRLNTDLPLGIDVEASPELRQELLAFGDRLNAQLRELLLGAAGGVVSFGATAVGLLFQLATISLLAFYLVADGPRVRRALARPLPPQRQREMLAIWEIAVAKTGGYIYSRLLLAIVATTLHAAFFLLIGLPYPVPLALWIGVTSTFIPVIGTYLGAAAALIVAFVSRPLLALLVLIFAVAYQQVENYLLAPRITARTMQLHPAIAFFAALAGGSISGLLGAFMALPAAAVIQATVSTYLTRHEVVESELTRESEPAPAADGATEGRRASVYSRLSGRLRRDRPSDP